MNLKKIVIFILFFSLNSVYAVDMQDQAVQTVAQALSKTEVLKACMKACFNTLKRLSSKVGARKTLHAARYVAGCWALCASCVNLDVAFNGGRFFLSQSGRLAALFKVPVFAAFGAVCLKPESVKTLANFFLRKIRVIPA